jgi:hypothetical protein
VTVRETIQIAEALLPGEPVAQGEDPRWQAILAITNYVETDPTPVWEFIRKWGNHPQEDLRTAVAEVLSIVVDGDRFQAAVSLTPST